MKKWNFDGWFLFAIVVAIFGILYGFWLTSTVINSDIPGWAKFLILTR